MLKVLDCNGNIHGKDDQTMAITQKKTTSQAKK